MAKGKKARFIDKKQASTYHLLHRSQRDVAGDVLQEGDVAASQMVLWPAAASLGAGRDGMAQKHDHILLTEQEKMQMNAWRERLQAAGLLQETSPTAYLKEATGAGTFVNANGHIGRATRGPGATAKHQEDTLLEVMEQPVVHGVFDVAVDCMDMELEQALFGDFEAGEFEELNDDFVLDANRPMPDGDDDFDFDAHIADLLHKARREQGDEVSHHHHPVASRDRAMFGQMRALHEEDENSEDAMVSYSDRPYRNRCTAMGAATQLSFEEEQALCDQFHATLAEYDSDEEDVLSERDTDSRDHEASELDDAMEAVLDDYLQEKKDDFFMRGRNGEVPRRGGSSFGALVGTRLVPAHAFADDHADADANNRDPIQSAQATLSAARERLAEPPLQPPAEEILIDGQSYFSQRERNPFDCESILTTYSNLDNNPIIIGVPQRRNKKKNKVRTVSGNSQQIQLSSKTGLPVTFRPAPDMSDHDGVDECLDDDTLVSVNKGEARDKRETTTEKRERKVAVKMERQLARMQKKITKQVFREEVQRRAVDVGSNDVAGKAVFSYS